MARALRAIPIGVPRNSEEQRYLKIVPKKKIDLTEFFDRADLGMNIEDWDEFERRFSTRGGLSGRNRAHAGREDGPE
jgi:hypothetical protein